MVEYRNPMREDVPAYFELGVLHNGEGLVVSAHRQFTESIRRYTANVHAPLFEFENELNLEPFNPFTDIHKPWGFGDVFVPGQMNEKWMRWHCIFPEGKHLFSTEEERQKRNGISASINVLSTLAQVFEDDEKTTSERKQLFQLNVLTGNGFSMAATMVTVTPSFASWMSTEQAQKTEQEIAKPMINAYNRLSGWPVDDFNRVLVSFRKPHFVHLSVPGNACGLDPDSHRPDTLDDGRPAGYKLTDHNVDSVIQHTTLVSGIAKMH